MFIKTTMIVACVLMIVGLSLMLVSGVFVMDNLLDSLDNSGIIDDFIYEYGLPRSHYNEWNFFDFNNPRAVL